MTHVTSIFESLSLNPWLRAEFLRDPAAFCRAQGLGEDDGQLLMAPRAPRLEAGAWNPCPCFCDPGAEHPDPDPPRIEPQRMQ